MSSVSIRTISPREIEAFLVLVDELSSVPICEIDDGLIHLLQRLCDMVGADDAFWIAATHQPDSNEPLAHTFDGWLPVKIISLKNCAERTALRQLIVSRSQQGYIDPYTQALVNQAGTDRALLRSDVISLKDERDHWMYRDIFAPGLLQDRMVGASSLSDKTETYLGFDRLQNQQPFGQHERDLMRFFCIGLKWFFSGLHRSYGLIDATRPLTSRERDVLLQILTDKSEKRIASDLAISPKTLHHHVTSLYRKFSVNSRSALMALWLNYRSEHNM